jgi:hypothetical protein
MLATGGLLICVALLTLAAVAPLFRSDNPPRWTTRGWVGELVTLAIVCMLAVGLGYFGAGAIAAFQTGPDLLDLGLLAVVLLVSMAIWRRLRARSRPGVLEPGVSAYDRAPIAGQVGSSGPVTVAVPPSEPPRPHEAA